MLEPGLDRLLADTGLVFTNIVTALNNNGQFPDGRIPEDTVLEFRMDPGQSLGDGLKYKVQALKQGNVEPFMASFQAGVSTLQADWSSEYRPQDLTDSKQLYAFYDSFLKHGQSSEPVNLVTTFNPRAQTFEQGTTFGMEASAYQPDASRDLVEDLWAGDGVNAETLQGMVAYTGDNGFWGPDNRSAGLGDWNTHVPMFEIPTQPLTSLAQFQHIQVGFMADESAYMVGNSRVSPFVGFSKISQQQLNDGPGNTILDMRGTRWDTGRAPDRNDWTMTRVDQSWILNDVLWDGYYFSGIAPGTGISSSGVRWSDHVLNRTPLPNSQFQAYAPLHGTDGSEWFQSGSGEPLAGSPVGIGGHMMVEGMFNVNSTSVEAWKALLAGTRRVDVLTAGGTETSSGTVFGRFLQPQDGENQEWTGFRGLTDEQICALAEAIVVQVKERGPFLSLSEFVNRRLSTAADPATVHPHMESGALQAAIDATSQMALDQGRPELAINSLFTQTLEDAGLTPAQLELNPWVRSRIDGDSLVAQGVNGDMTQADVLTAIGPLLSARSDTFLIRSYGEVTDSSGGILSRAWCEVVVQRVPDYLDSSRSRSQAPGWAPHESLPATTTYDTQTPRRQFRILRFRWLNEEDV